MKPIGRKYFRAAMLAVIGAAATACATPALAQKEKDSLRYAFQRSTQALDMYLDPGLHTTFTQEIVFDTLISYNDATMKFEPLLAKSWKQIDDVTLEFQLRDDVKWHDGQPFTADDVVSTLNWITDPKTTTIRFKGNWEFIGKVEKVGTHVVRIIAKEPTPYALTRLAYLTTMEAAHAHGKADDKVVYAATKPVGTGMYKVVDIDRNKGIVLERNPEFKHGGTAKAPSNIGKIQMPFIPDAGTRIAQFLVRNEARQSHAMDADASRFAAAHAIKRDRPTRGVNERIASRPLHKPRGVRRRPRWSIGLAVAVVFDDLGVVEVATRNRREVHQHNRPD